MDLNGNAITVSNEIWEEHEARRIPALAAPEAAASDLGDGAEARRRRARRARASRFRMGMVFPLSTHNYELRYWLAAGGHPPRLLHGDGHHRNAGTPTC